MRVILDATEMMGIALAQPENQERADTVMSLPHQVDSDTLPANVTDAVAGLWKDAGVQECFTRSREFQLNDSAK